MEATELAIYLLLTTGPHIQDYFPFILEMAQRHESIGILPKIQLILIPKMDFAKLWW